MKEQEATVFDATLQPLATFKRTFGRDPTPDYIAELYVARELGLQLAQRRNEPGCDALGPDGLRYQVKCRSAATLNIDTNNFDFDFIVLVNVDDDYRLAGMWKMDKTTAERIFSHRPQYRKWQITQSGFKARAERLR
jgi:hypothetical protein